MDAHPPATHAARTPTNGTGADWAVRPSGPDPIAIIHRALSLVVPQFRLDLHHGWHGIEHWARVWTNARFLCRETGADPTVPCWFAFLHDSQRCSEGSDSEHGERAAAFARKHHAKGDITLDAGQLAELEFACIHHSGGATTGPLTAQICWDADRLDLSRVGVTPRADRLCTEPAKRPETIERAIQRGLYARARGATPADTVARLSVE